jgi:hypothetical protein
MSGYKKLKEWIVETLICMKEFFLEAFAKLIKWAVIISICIIVLLIANWGLAILSEREQKNKIKELEIKTKKEACDEIPMSEMTYGQKKECDDLNAWYRNLFNKVSE